MNPLFSDCHPPLITFPLFIDSFVLSLLFLPSVRLLLLETRTMAHWLIVFSPLILIVPVVFVSVAESFEGVS